MSARHYSDYAISESSLPKIRSNGIATSISGQPLEALWFYPATPTTPRLCRARYPDGEGKKILWYRQAERKWKSGLGGFKPPLYGLNTLREPGFAEGIGGGRTTVPVFLVEGEKAAAALHRCGLPAVALPGTGSAESIDLSPLDGYDIVLWPDFDAPGTKAMDTVYNRLSHAPRIIDPVVLGLPEKGDAADFVDRLATELGVPDSWDGSTPFPCGDGTDIGEVVMGRLGPALKSIPAPEPPPPLWCHMPDDWQNMVLPPQRFLFEGVFPVGYVSLLIGPGGLGKSWLMLIAAASLATGKRLLGALEPTEPPMQIVYLTLEDDFIECHRRLQKIFRAYRLDDEDARLICENIRFYAIPSFCCVSVMPDGAITESGALATFKLEVTDFSPGAVFMDPSTGLIGGLDENSNPDITAFLGMIRQAMPPSAATVLVCHVAKVDMGASTTARGAGAWTNSARQTVALRPLEEQEKKLVGQDAFRHVAFLGRKANYAGDMPAPFYMRKLAEEDTGGVLVDAEFQSVQAKARTAEICMVCSRLPAIIEEFVADGGVTRLELKGKSKDKVHKAKAIQFKNALSDTVGFDVTAKVIEDAVKELVFDGTLITVTGSEHRKVLTLSSKVKAKQSGNKAENGAATKAENVLPLQGELYSPLFDGEPTSFSAGGLGGQGGTK